MSICSIPQVTVLSDHMPEGDADGKILDQFALQERLTPVFDILRHKDTVPPLAIALYGNAGTGKTTALKLLIQRMAEWNGMLEKERAGHPRVLTVWFSALKYGSVENISREMMSELILQCLSCSELLGVTGKLERLVEAAETCGAMLGRRFVLELESIGRRMGMLHVVRVTTKAIQFESVFSESCLKEAHGLLEKWLMPQEEGGGACANSPVYRRPQP